MNKRLIALAVLATSGAAMAQSSVTLWGVLDLGLGYQSTSGSHQTTMTNGGLDGANKLGFKGIEDLGGGNGAAFYLESGYSANNGQGSATGGGLQFQRRSTVSLTGGWGEIRLGRDFNVSFENYVLGDAFGDSGIAAAADNLQYNNAAAGGTNYFVNNAVSYQYGFDANASTWGFGAKGLYAKLQYALAGNPSGTKANGQYVGARVGYAAGPFNAALALAQSTNVDSAGVGGVTFKEWNVAARYELPVATLIASGGQNNNNSEAEGSPKFTHITLGAQIPAGPGYIPLSWATTKQNGAGGTTASLLGAGYVYNLSKRTSLYGTLAYYKNGSNVAYNANGDIGGSLFTKNGSSATAFQVGLKHGF